MKRKADDVTNTDRDRKKLKITIGGNLEEMPNEIVREIITHLNDTGLRRMRMVNKRIYSLISISHFTIGLIHDAEMEELVRVFGRYDRPIGLTFKKPYYIKNNISRLAQLTQLTSLDINPSYITRKFEQLTNLRLTCLSINSVHVSTLKCLTALEQLTTNRISMPAVDTLPCLTQITKLTLKFDVNSYQSLYTMPNIKHLHLTPPDDPNMLLTSLNCRLTGLESLSTPVMVVPLPAHTMTSLTVLMNQFDTEELSKLTNLRRLDINNNTTNVLTEFMRSLLPFTSLESLAIKGLIFDPFFTQLNSSNIRELVISISRARNVEHLATFTNLRHLSLHLEDNDIFSMEELSTLTRLTSVHVTGCSDTENVNACTALKNLLELHLEQLEATLAYVTLSYLTKLTNLSLGGVKSFIDLSNMTNLKRLFIAKKRVFDRPTIVGLSTLTNLTSLDASIDPCTYQIISLTSLQEFSSLDYVNAPDLESMSNLCRLTLLRGQTRGTGESLTRLTSLQYLSFTAEEVSNSIREQLQQKLINCHQMHYFCHYYNRKHFCDDEE
jgi:hypothetical protein